MLGEITDNSNRAKAYSVSSAVINIATLVGPVVGSGLARPADRYQFCAGWVIFQKSPYLLPSLATGLFGYLAFLSNALFLKEVSSTRDSDPRHLDLIASSIITMVTVPDAMKHFH